MQSNYSKSQKQKEYKKQIEEDLIKNKKVEEEIIKEKYHKQELKKKLFDQEQEVLKIKNYENLTKEQEKLREKQSEMDLYYKRLEEDSLREKKYKNFYKSIEDKQAIFQNLYSNQIAPKNFEKRKNLNDWIDRNIEQKAKLSKYKDLYEQKLKQDNINNIKQVWQFQMEERQKKFRDLKEEQQNLYNTIQRQVNESKRLDQIRENEKRRMQNVYKESLLGQANYRRNSASKFEYLDANSNNHSLDGIERKASPRFEKINHNARSNSVTNSQYHDLSNTPANFDPILEKVGSASGSDHSSVLTKFSIHNPITNPIGDHSPKPIQRPLFKPHTLIAY